MSYLKETADVQDIQRINIRSEGDGTSAQWPDVGSEGDSSSAGHSDLGSERNKTGAGSSNALPENDRRRAGHSVVGLHAIPLCPGQQSILLFTSRFSELGV